VKHKKGGSIEPPFAIHFPAGFAFRWDCRCRNWRIIVGHFGEQTTDGSAFARVSIFPGIALIVKDRGSSSACVFASGAVIFTRFGDGKAFFFFRCGDFSHLAACFFKRLRWYRRNR
jgi:hypothetical protein